MTEPRFVLDRHFDAPKALVWRCWTETELVQRWYGPGIETEVHAFDPTPGGLWLSEMRMEGNSMYQRMEFSEVEEPDRLVLLMSNADANWSVTPSLMMPNWPLTLLTEIDLATAGDGTDLTLTWTPHEASAEEQAAFAAAVPNLQGGWNAGMDIISQILDELQA